MSLSWHRAVVAGISLTICGCNTLLGLDPLSYQGAGDGGPGGGSGGTTLDGGQTNADSGVSTTLVEACVHYLEASCEFGLRCQVEYYVHRYGSLLADCIDDLSHSMECDKADRMYGLPGSNVKPSSLDACSAALYAASCDSTDSCLPPPGNLSNGQPCASSFQCASSNCKDVHSNVCGTCASPEPKVYGQIGEACGWVTSTKYVDCAGTKVTCKDAVCTPTASRGQSCSDTVICAPTSGLTDPILLCENGICVGYGTEGMPCIAADPTPYCRNRFYCKAGTSTCTANRHVKIGESCQPLAGETVDCPDGWCPCPDASNPNPVCKASPHEGEPCVSSKCGPPASGSGCAAGLTCVGGTTCGWSSVSSWVPPTSCSGS
jgi:hypothetical protein